MHQIEPTNRGNFNQDSKLHCLYTECNEVYPDQLVAVRLDADSFQAYQTACVEVLSASIYREEEAKWRGRVQEIRREMESSLVQVL